MSTKHTPGPWIATGPHLASNNHAFMAVHREDADPMDPSECVARVFTSFSGNDCGPDDARLIAAAPDLLVALEALLFNSRHGNGLEAHYAALDRADAAIAKARGKG